MGELNLPKFILQKIGSGALQYAQGTALKARGVFAGLDALAASLDADHLDRGVIEKWVKQAHGIRTTPNASDEQVGQSLLLLQDLSAGFIADHPLKVSHH